MQFKQAASVGCAFAVEAQAVFQPKQDCVKVIGGCQGHKNHAVGQFWQIACLNGMRNAQRQTRLARAAEGHDRKHMRGSGLQQRDDLINLTSATHQRGAWGG